MKLLTSNTWTVVLLAFAGLNLWFFTTNIISGSYVWAGVSMFFFLLMLVLAHRQYKSVQRGKYASDFY